MFNDAWELQVYSIKKMPVVFCISFRLENFKIAESYPYKDKSRDSSVGIALGYGLDDRGSRFRFSAGARNFSLHRVQNGSGVHQPPIQWVPGALSLGVKRPLHEADHSPPSSSEVKEWVELYLHSLNMPSWRGAPLKHGDNFTFYLYLTHIRNSWYFPS
jgi:hypothetical protein